MITLDSIVLFQVRFWTKADPTSGSRITSPLAFIQVRADRVGLPARNKTCLGPGRHHEPRQGFPV